MSAEVGKPVALSTEPVRPVEETNKDGASDSIPATIPAMTEKIQKPHVELKTAPSSPIAKLFSELPALIAEAGYGEMWGIELKDAPDIPTSIVLEKFLRANMVDKKKDVAKAKAQLLEALKRRKKLNPRRLMDDTEFDDARFGGLGYVTVYPHKDGKEIVTWNNYGGIKDIKGTFGNVQE